MMCVCTYFIVVSGHVHACVDVQGDVCVHMDECGCRCGDAGW